MRALWSTVFAWACLFSSAGCGESSTTDTPSSNGGQYASTGGGLPAVGGVQNPGGTGNGGIPAGGVPNGSGGLLVGNGGIVNGSGGFLAAGGLGNGGLVNTGGLFATGGFVGNGGTPPETGGAPPGTGGGTTLGPYPAGPYGVAVGNTFPNLQLQGYVNDTAVGLANTKPFVPLYTMENLRASGARYALLHNSNFF